VIFFCLGTRFVKKLGNSTRISIYGKFSPSILYQLKEEEEEEEALVPDPSRNHDQLTTGHLTLLPGLRCYLVEQAPHQAF
jgi:hypothetical protein